MSKDKERTVNTSITLLDSHYIFLRHTAEHQYPEKPVISHVLRDILSKIIEKKEVQEAKKYKMLVCPECGSEYSEKLGECPYCRETRAKTLKEADWYEER